MIDGLTARWVENTDLLKEVELNAHDSASEDASLILTVILVVGPPDPNALSYLVPRSVFERGHPVHVGALAHDQDITEGLLEILELMGSKEIVVFICEDDNTLNQAINILEPAKTTD